MPSDKLGCHVKELKFSCATCGAQMDKPCIHWRAWIKEPQPKDRTLSMMEVHPKLIQLRREHFNLVKRQMEARNFEWLRNQFIAAKKTKAK